MTTDPDRQQRPRTWSDLRDRVLHQDYLVLSDLEHRKRRAGQMKYALWIALLALTLLVPVVIAEGISLPIAVAILLICGGAIASYRLGTRWERRWEELIREKSALAGRE